MGRYYALHDKEDAAVADAVRDHYKPVGPSDAVPSDKIAIAVALADKLDQLTGFFAVGEKPTGSGDPFALRRAALGVFIRVDRYRKPASALPLDETLATRCLSGFFADRLKVALKEKGVRHDLIDAVFALGQEDDLVRLVARVEALQAFLKTEDGAALMAGYKRAANILKAEEKKDGRTYISEVAEGLLDAPAEKSLFAALSETKTGIAPALEKEDFAAAMRQMAALRGPVDAFFDGVKVNDENPKLRENRLNLLASLRAALHQVADFSRIEG